ncbi:MAG: hypothetical protein NC925_05775 [Candidatus Omnitrophica bacterium]|nr:hypothetical protein [Candidatus Omnitrophota bacterium]MCM8832051.1 hypothetical protein [Candidatus Omnitrophota bacterium]
MGRYKKELKKIHAKKVRKAKEQVRAFLKGEIPYEKLTQRAKYFLEKRRQKEKELKAT